MASYRNMTYPKLDDSKYDANFVAFLVKEGIRRDVAEQVSDDLGTKMTICTMSLRSHQDTDGLRMSEEDRINIRLLMLLVIRFQKSRVGQLWNVWYDTDLSTCLQNNGIDVSAARTITTDLHVLDITGLNHLGQLTRDKLDNMQWADTTKNIIWRLREMVWRYPEVRTQTVSAERRRTHRRGGGAGLRVRAV